MRNSFGIWVQKGSFLAENHHQKLLSSSIFYVKNWFKNRKSALTAILKAILWYLVVRARKDPVLPAKYCIYIIVLFTSQKSFKLCGRDDFTREPLCLLRSMQPDKTADITTGFPTKWRLRNERRNSILMTLNWLNEISHAARPIRSTTQTWVVTRHQYGISALVSQTSFGGER